MMTDTAKVRLNGGAGWITAAISVAGILVITGGIYTRVCISSETNARQDMSISSLERDMAVMKSLTARTATDVDEIKRDVKTLLRRDNP